MFACSRAPVFTPKREVRVYVSQSPYKVTGPYSASDGQLCSGTCNATTTTYDALGRPTLVTDPGNGTTNGTVKYAYPQNDVLQTLSPSPSGENTKQRQMEYDGLGRLTSVCELTAGTDLTEFLYRGE